MTCDVTEGKFSFLQSKVVPKHNDVVAHYLKMFLKLVSEVSGNCRPCHAERSSDGKDCLILPLQQQEKRTSLIQHRRTFTSDYIKVSCSKDILEIECNCYS